MGALRHKKGQETVEVQLCSRQPAALGHYRSGDSSVCSRLWTDFGPPLFGLPLLMFNWSHPRVDDEQYLLMPIGSLTGSP